LGCILKDRAICNLKMVCSSILKEHTPRRSPVIGTYRVMFIYSPIGKLIYISRIARIGGLS